MLKFVFILAIAYLLLRVVRRWLISGRVPRREQGYIDDEMVRDPVCGVYVPQHEAFSLRMDGERRYFCSEACRHAFEENPSGYGAGKEPTQPPNGSNGA